MKWRGNVSRWDSVWSLPTRGAWIEIWLSLYDMDRQLGRSPRGERGLKYAVGLLEKYGDIVAPHAGSVD